MGLLGDYNRTHINTCVFCICTPIQVYCSSCIWLYFHAIPYDKRLSCSYHHTVTQHPRSTLLANELLTELCLTAHKAQDAKAGLWKEISIRRRKGKNTEARTYRKHKLIWVSWPRTPNTISGASGSHQCNANELEEHKNVLLLHLAGARQHNLWLDTHKDASPHKHQTVVWMAYMMGRRTQPQSLTDRQAQTQ